jgi:hypothetical protein
VKNIKVSFGTELFELLNELVDNSAQKKKEKELTIVDCIEEVMYNGPATIIFWKDGTKTVAICSAEDTFDSEKGLAVCMLKWLLGNNSHLDVFREYAIETEDDEDYQQMLEDLDILDQLLQTKKLTQRQREALINLVFDDE